MNYHPSVDIQPMVQALIEVLDRDIDNIEQNIKTLEAIRSHLIKRDESSLSHLLEEVRLRQRTMVGHETQREGLRQILATTLGVPHGELTLSCLARYLTEPLKTQLTQKRHCLQDLANQLQGQWQLTSALLQDCARLNKKLFQSIFDQNTPQTYGPSGWQGGRKQANLVNMHI